MRLTQAIEATLKEQWPELKKGILDDLEKAREYHFEPNRKISNIGLSILNKLNDGDSNRYSYQEYEKLHNEASLNNQFIYALTSDHDDYIRGLCEAAAWARKDDIELIIYEMNNEKANN